MTPYPIGAAVLLPDIGATGQIVSVINKGALNPITGYRIRLDDGERVYRLHHEVVRRVPIMGAAEARPDSPRRSGPFLVFDGGRA